MALYQKDFSSYRITGGVFYVNGEKCDAAQLSDFIENHPNYIYTEFLYPSEQMKEIFPLIHTVRVLVIKDGKELPQIGGAYMRFGTKDSGYANYMTCTENMKYVYDVNINPESGEYGAGKAVYRNHVEDMPCHPDTGVLVEGKIEAWAEARNMVIALAEYIGLVEYMGFDICFTDQGIKIMEINSHSGIKHLQMRKPLLKEPWSRVYFESKIKKIEMMTEEQIKKRNQMIR